MAKKRKRIPPSRQRYDQGRPVVSCRVSRQIRDRLQTIKKLEGRSMADILKAGLGLFEVKVRTERELKEEGYVEGVNEGFDVASSDFRVTYPCSVCGKPIDVDTEEEKKAIRKFMIDGGWRHGDCRAPNE